MLSLAMSSLLILQQAGEVIEAVHPDDPQTWTLEYPVIISPYVDDYYNCLKSRELFVGDGRSFERQHSDAIPQCTKVQEMALNQANTLLEKRGRAAKTTPQDVDKIFRTIQAIHVQRGRDLDSAINVQLVAGRRARSSLPNVGPGGVSQRATVSPEEAAACKARLSELRAARQTYAESEGARVEAIRAKETYSEEDQKELWAYQRGLARYSSNIAYEMRRCPPEVLDEHES